MILTVDIGNTSVVVGGFDDGPEPVFTRRLPSRRDRTLEDWRADLTALLEEAAPGAVPSGCALSSVAPELAALLLPVLEELTGEAVVTVGPGLDEGLVLVDYDRKGLGNDRVADMVGALAQFQPPLAIFDLGTATTLSVVDGDGRFIGGMILPGMRLSVDALSARASQLPPVPLEPPKALLGNDALTCMQSGIVFGTAAQIDGLSDRVAELLGRPVTTVLTGGNSSLVLPYCRCQPKYDEHLLLKGLRLLYQRNRPAES